MSGANSNISLVGLDFDTIKSNFKTFLQGQDTFKDYNFEGSGLSTILDVLAYNTQYNAFYLNMVANEMFLDTAQQRSSVVSHAKLMNYTPQSAVAPTAFANVIFYGVTTPSMTIPQYTNFMSESVNGVNYNFVTTDALTVDTDTLGNAVFNNVELKQGIPVNYTFNVDSSTNPEYIFVLPDDNIDISSLKVSVQKSSSNTSYEIFSESLSFISLNGSSLVYFIDETLDGYYQISFGDGILGKQLTDGNIVRVNYIVTQGTSSAGANNFVLMDSINQNYVSAVVNPYVMASNGSEKESIDSVKYQAPKSFSAQNRAVTKDDYITLIQQNNVGISFDAVNVWGGEENDPPVYGSIFICLKPKGSYTFTDTQKTELIEKTIKPISLMTVEPKIIDPDYTYIQISSNVLFDQKKTNLSQTQLADLIKTVVRTYADSTLNTFNSNYSSTDIGIAIKNSNQSILTSDINTNIQKKIYPDLNNSTTYNLYYNTELERGTFYSGVSSSPTFTMVDKNTSALINGVYIEEIPSATSSIDSISIVNPGYSYQVTPTATISGDGTGATAEVILVNGAISKINVLTSGNNYTSAVVTITPDTNDTTGTGAVAVANLKGNIGKLRTYYYNSNNYKIILNPNAGTIDYSKGIISLIDFNPVEINNPLGQLTITAIPKTQLLQSTYNTIITVDAYDPNAISVNLQSK